MPDRAAPAAVTTPSIPALGGFRIIETAETPAGEYCGKLLADFGAEVVKIERPGSGAPTRDAAPRIAGVNPGFAFRNTNKRSIVIDVAGPQGRDRLHRLVASADAVVDDHDAPWLAAVGLDDAATRQRHPRLVVCSVTPFGLDAPPEAHPATSLTVFHASGWGHHTPSHADPASPPLQGPGRHSPDHEAGLDAALCVVAALFAQIHRGTGEFVDVSQHAALVSRADCILGRFLSGEITPDGSRADYDQQGPAAFFPCADGYVYLYVTNRAHWAALGELLGRPGWFDDFDDDWLEFSVTADKVARFHDGFAPWIAGLDQETAATRAQRLGVPLVPVNAVDALALLPQYRHREFFRAVPHPVLGTVRHPGVPYVFSVSPAEIVRSAPDLGQDAADASADAAGRRRPPTPRSGPPRAPVRPRGGPLQGVRVVELTKVWAGPYAGKLLAFLGAEVIKVENSAMPEEMRAYGGTDVDHAPFFLSINPEVLSVDIDYSTAAGMSRLRDLIADSDVVLNNLRPGAMERHGLGHDDLVALKDDIVSVSIKMWGNDGPLGYQTGYAPCFAALAGMAALVGHSGGPPLGASMRYGDSTVGAAAAYAAVVALLHRDVTGRGQSVDVSAVEVLTTMIGDRVLEQALSGEPLDPDGPGHPDYAPHGCFRCDDGWLALAVSDDDAWHRVCDVLDAPGLAADPRFATAPGRAGHADVLEAELTAVLAGHSAAALAARLRGAGVAATRSATALDVIADESLWQREAYRFVSDHVEGLRPVLGTSWRLRRDPTRIEYGAPRLGEHDDVIFGQVDSR